MAENTATTFRVSDKEPKKHFTFPTNGPFEEQIKRQRQYNENNCTEILQMSNFPQQVRFSDNGFVQAVIDAYNNHLNLNIRPDDVWGAIMTQLSFYINKHATEFGRNFVKLKGRKKVKLCLEGLLSSDSNDISIQLMLKEITKNLVDHPVNEWILPNFSTTTDNDMVTIGVIFSATIKKPFDCRYSCSSLSYGIPYITLEGTVNDWKNVLQRLEKLKDYKLEKWFHMLRPIIQQFIKAKEENNDVEFWQRIVHHYRLDSGSTCLSGWITAFCAFDKDGFWQGSYIPENSTGDKTELAKQCLEIDIDNIPTGIVEVDVNVTCNGMVYNSIMLAGHLASEIKENGNTIQPTLGWVIALKANVEDNAETD